MSLVNVHIPRILGNVNRQAIVKRFNELELGRVFYIDMHKKVNENNNVYYFAFLSIQMYETTHATKLLEALDNDGIARVVYDTKMNKYWEVKKFVDRAVRRSDCRSECRSECRSDLLSLSECRSYSPDSVVDQVEQLDEHIIKSIINSVVKPKQTRRYSPSIFTVRDKLEMADEYMELENEISLLCCGR